MEDYIVKITVECECGNNTIMKMINGKAFVVRDNLERNEFYCNENEIKGGSTKEILLQCNKCKKWVILDMD